MLNFACIFEVTSYVILSIIEKHIQTNSHNLNFFLRLNY